MNIRTILAVPFYAVAVFFIILSWIVGGDEMEEHMADHLHNFPDH